MARILQFRRGDTATLDGITGAEGELFVDLDTYTLRVHDGTTEGGHIIGDVDFYADQESFPETGLNNKIYLAEDTGFFYRWSGSDYSQVGGTPDTNTTYSVAASAVTGGANIDLTDSNSAVDSVTFSGSGSVTVSQVDANTIQISGTDTDTTYSDATTSVSGLMSSTDKSKLDNIAANAEVNVQADWNETDTASDAFIKNKPTIPVDTNTTYTVNADTVDGGAKIDLIGSDATTDTVEIIGGTNVTVTRDDEDTITISSTDTNTTYTAGTGLSLSGTQFSVDSTIATQTYVNTAVANLVDTAPSTLDTLNELAAALGDDPNFATTVTNSIAGKQPLDADLTAIAGLADTSGLLKKTAANTWVLDTNTYVTSSGVTSVTGTAPIASSGGATPSISISAATASAAGSMSATDKSKLDGIAASANNYSLPAATSTVRGGIELFSDTVQSTGANNVSNSAGRTYGLQVNSDGQAVVNVPWVDTNTTYSNATTSTAGLMSSTDKSKLDNIAANAEVNVQANWNETNTASDAYILNKPTIPAAYSLPTATDTTLGGVKLGSATAQTTGANAVTTTSSRTYAIQNNSSGQLVVNVPWVDTNTTYSNATTSVSGLMSSTDKSKLNGIAANANNYSLPAATSTVRGGIELFSNTVQSTGANSVSNSAGRTYGIQVNSNGQAVVNVPWVDTNTTYSNATTSASGLMSSTDKSKLDSLSYEEGSFTPQMTDAFGGVISTGINGKYIKVGNTIQGTVTFNFSGATYIYSNSAEYQIWGLPFWPTFSTTMPIGMGHKNFVQGNNPVGLLTIVSPAGNAELAVVNNTGATINMYPGISLFFNITNND
jgi:hypothetical protein